MRSSISSDRARSFTFRTVGAYYSNVMQAVWPRLALRSYGEGANMAKNGFPVSTRRVKVFYRYSIGWYRAIHSQTSPDLERKALVQTLE